MSGYYYNPYDQAYAQQAYGSPGYVSSPEMYRSGSQSSNGSGYFQSPPPAHRQLAPSSSAISRAYYTQSPFSSSDFYSAPSLTRSHTQNSCDGGKDDALYCLFQGCTHTCARKADLERHVAVIHNRGVIDLIDCTHPGCHRTGKSGFTRRDKMRDHLREVHKYDIAKRGASSGGKW